jgi:hypothetical protein
VQRIFPPGTPDFSLAAQMRMRCQAVDRRRRDDARKAATQFYFQIYKYFIREY